MAKKRTDVTIRSSAAEYLTFVAASGGSEDSVEMRYEDENLWLTQKMMATLYDVDVRTINEHIKKVLSDGELSEESTIRKFRIVQNEGVREVHRNVLHYGLQMVIAVGFKVNSERAVQFRKWVNGIAMTYTIKGWVMDDERLKNSGSILTKQYFEEQLEKIREIRASEKLPGCMRYRNLRNTASYRIGSICPIMTGLYWKWRATTTTRRNATIFHIKIR